MTSTNTCNLDIPWLPNHVTEAHIAPGLAHASLISTRKFCEAGCKLIFDTKECRVYYKGKPVLAGGKDKNTALWKLHINPKINPTPNRQGHHIESLNIRTARGKKIYLTYSQCILVHTPIQIKSAKVHASSIF